MEGSDKMSTGAGCRINQTRQNEWYYELQRYPYGMTQEYNRYGPFRTYRAAVSHLDSHHANPGGFMINRLEDLECEHEWQELNKYTLECYKCGRCK